ncbi:MAG: glycosyltransferase family 2 protein, partial [Deltaproteobacteria bacterium]|nr:glycosyltransferase family 2 protein [Deltaproteobacteria bacterium]
SYEVVLVDDGSPDDVWNVIASLHEEHPERVVGVQLMRNFGQHNALMAGLRRARGAVIVTLDDDLQHPPEEIPKLIRALEEGGFDLVYGTYEQRQHKGWRNFGSSLVTGVFRRLFGVAFTFTSFRAMRSELARSVFTYSLNFTFLDGLFAWNTNRIGSVPVRHEARQEGASGYSVSKLLLLSLNMLTNFSLLPLQVVSWLGVAAAGAGLSLGGMYLVVSLFGLTTVPGYASIIVAVLILGGIQLLALGIIGEYLGRVHLNINRKPQYLERQVLDIAPENPKPPQAEE